MKQLFRCDYCNEIGTEEEIREHEESCLWNYTKKSCYTCKHAERSGINFLCKGGEDLELGRYMQGCASWEYNGQNHAKKNPFGNFLGGPFI